MVYLVFVLGLIAVVKGGDWLVDSAVWFAKVLGIPQVIIGATIVSLGTTLPETLISTFAALEGSGDIVVGTALGSILFNTGIILGVNILINPLKIESKDTFFKVGTMIGVVLLFTLLGSDGTLGGLDTVIILALLVVYIASNIWAGSQGDKSEKIQFTHQELIKHGIHFLVGITFVIIGARVLLDSGIEIARNLGISEAIIAVTLFAVGSSLPELATSVTAAIKGHTGLFLGNILGANTLNILMVIGVSSAISSISITQEVLFSQVPVILILMGILVIPAFFTKKITRFQGVLAALIYLGYVTFITIS